MQNRPALPRNSHFSHCETANFARKIGEIRVQLYKISISYNKNAADIQILHIEKPPFWTVFFISTIATTYEAVPCSAVRLRAGA